MIIKIPIITQEWDEDKEEIVTKKDKMVVDIDTSFKAHLKWEEQFQPTLGVDLTTYSARLQKMLKTNSKAKGEMLSLLKWLYCYVSSPKLPTFKEFCGLIDFNNAEPVLDKIGTVLEEIGKTASKN